MIDLKTVRQHLVVDDNLDDRILEGYRDAALECVEEDVGRVIKQRSFTDEFDSFALICLNTPVATVSEIRYIDQLGATQVLSASVYTVITGLNGSVEIQMDQSWPSAQKVMVDYSAGYTVASLPRKLWLAILKKTLDFYENRESHEFVKGGQCNAAYLSLIRGYQKDLVR
ncbi:MAG: phage head-tail connector protein [Agarilytica sp.]